MKYYYVICKVVSFLDIEHIFNVAISEEPEKFALRMKKYTAGLLDDKFEMHQWRKISVKEYSKLRPFNPTNESYLEMKKKDYGEKAETIEEEWWI